MVRNAVSLRTSQGATPRPSRVFWRSSVWGETKTDEELAQERVRAIVHWADGRSQRPALGSHLGAWLREPGCLSPEDILDRALTVTSLVSTFEPPLGRTYLVIYGAPDILQRYVIAREIAERLAPGRKNPRGVVGMVCGVLESRQREFLFGTAIRRAALAKLAAVSRQAFLKGGWPELHSQACEIIDMRCSRVERWLAEELNARGVWV